MNFYKNGYTFYSVPAPFSLSPEFESLSPGSSLNSASPLSYTSNVAENNNNVDGEGNKSKLKEKIIYVPTRKVGYLIGYKSAFLLGFLGLRGEPTESKNIYLADTKAGPSGGSSKQRGPRSTFWSRTRWPTRLQCR